MSDIRCPKERRPASRPRPVELARYPHSLAASLAALPSMSLIPFTPFAERSLWGASDIDGQPERAREWERTESNRVGLGCMVPLLDQDGTRAYHRQPVRG